MKAGFGRACITPPVGTRMSGFGGRDEEKGAEDIHDDLHVRALYAEHEGESVLIVGYDLLFFSRENADRMKAAIGRVLDFSPRQILLNSSHTHVGPCVSTWGYERRVLPDRDYLNAVEAGSCEAALAARKEAREVSLWIGATTTGVPVSRRRPGPDGQAQWRPYPEADICRSLPLCLMKDADDNPVCLLYSISCHPSSIGGWSISADYPGVACRLLDEHLGAPCSLFLQGAGGDAKAFVTTRGHDATGLPSFQGTDWAGVEEAGALAASEAISALPDLEPASPRIASHLLETQWPLEPLPGRAGFEKALEETSPARSISVREHLARLDQGLPNPTVANILAHGIQLAEGCRLVAIEGEMVGELGNHLIAQYDDGVTMPLGYSNGAGLYLPSTRMLPQGGYEVDSHHEYGYGAVLAPGMEDILRDAVAEMRAHGVG